MHNETPPTDRAPYATEKLQFVAEQMATMAADPTMTRMDCPYCLGRTKKKSEFCCELMARAFKAIMDAEEQIQIAQFMDSVIERHLSN